MRKFKKRYFSLVSLLIYMAVLAVILNIAYLVYYQGIKNCRLMRAAADDILRISRLGDRWRKEVRHAKSIEFKNSEMTITRKDGGKIIYRFDHNTIQQKDGPADKWTTLMEEIKSCTFTEKKYSGFNAWEMNVTLKTRAEKAKIQPVFSFISVN